MRTASLVLAAVCAVLALASTTTAVQAADQARVHIRVGTVAKDDANSISAVAVADIDTDVPVETKSKSHHLRALINCRALANEGFKYDIVSMCAVRNAGFDFYYQLTDGSILRNCLCESFNKGVMDVNLGSVVVSELNVQCSTKNPKLDGAAVKKIFNKRSITCDPFGF
ncbi:hypothetical protein Gpo141_00010016 [Globisporangium polare]